MHSAIFRGNNLTKKYKSATALDHINISINKGDICALVGQNGSGKTTLLKIIVGLIKPTAGNISLFGVTEPERMDLLRARVGYLPDQCALYPDVDAYTNLLFRKIEWGITEKYCIEDTLALVGLTDVKGKKVKEYSLGMKQRLGLAVALLGDPEFLILDEPINGLDPTGIIELRRLLERLNSEKGVTILISSHILSELSHIATHFAFLHCGRMLQYLSAKDLTASLHFAIRLQVENPVRAAEVLHKCFPQLKYKVTPEGAMRIYAASDALNSITKSLIENAINVMQISFEEETLEDYYIRLIGAQNA